MSSSDTPHSKRNASFWPWLSLIAAIVILVTGYFLAGWQHHITITESQAQTLLDQKVAEFRAKNPDVTIDHLRIHFRDNEMTIDAAGGKEFSNKKYGPQLVTVALLATGDPDYRRGSIYFNANTFDFDELALNGEDPLEVAKRVIATVATETPVVRDTVLANDKLEGAMSWLKEKAGVEVNIDETANDAAIKVVEAAAHEFVETYRVPAEQYMERTVISILEDTPLYTLDHNLKERAATAVLDDIGIENGVFTATLSGMVLIRTILLGVIVLGLSVLFAVGLARGGSLFL